jgi:hypothetical protein
MELERRIVPTGPVSLVSHAAPGFYADSAGDYCGGGSISADGRYTVYSSESQNLVNGQIDKYTTYDLFLFDRVANTTTLISHAAGAPTTAANQPTTSGSISADGQVVVFSSPATDLVSGFVDGNGSSSDLYAYETSTGITTLISHAAGSMTTGANGDIPVGWASANGRYVIFSSPATNLISGFTDGNGAANSDVFVFDRVTGTTRLVSHSTASSTAGGNGSSSAYSISADGRYIAVTSNSTNLIAGFSGTTGNAFVYDQTMDSMTLVSRKAGGAPNVGSGISSAVGISADGHFVAVASTSTALISGFVPPSTYGLSFYLYDLTTGGVQLITHDFNSSVTAVPAGSFFGVYGISSDGRFVLYNQNANNLVNGFVDNNNSSLDSWDLFLYDRVLNASILVDRKVGTTTQTANVGAPFARMSSDGRYITFNCRATDLVSGFIDGNAGRTDYDSDSYLFDRVTGTVTLVSHIPGSPTTSGNGGSFQGAISGDGTCIAYKTFASNLSSGANGINTNFDVTLYDRVADSNSLVTRRASNMPSLSSSGTYASQFGQRVTSDDGRFAVYVSIGGNLVSGQIDGFPD